MHVFFSGIGGAGIGPLALIAAQAGWEVSGSDKKASQYTDYLRQHGINDIHIGQTAEAIAAVHQRKPIDWLVYTSALTKERPDHPELNWAVRSNIKHSKRDEFINQLLADKQLQMVAIAGTHGKTTTTAMVVWLFKLLGMPISYSVGAKISFGDMGHYAPGSQYFVYEADEFDRNFLAFRPHMSAITGVTWDHHEIYPSAEEYAEAFKHFVEMSRWAIVWQEDAERMKLISTTHRTVLSATDPAIESIALAGHYNRLDAWLAIQTVHRLTGEDPEKLMGFMAGFPGLQRRMEQLAPNLYSDYAHTPEKIRGGLSVATEMARAKDQKVVIVYEPLTNRRQHYMMDDYKDCFNGASKVYWIPSYLAREDPDQRIIPPAELITHLADPSIAQPMERDDQLQAVIQQHLDAGDMVVGMAGGGGDSLDEWLRERFVGTPYSGGGYSG